MSELPDCIRSVERKARKEHKCCECYQTITKGQVYTYTSGVWNGEPEDFKQCLACSDIMDKASIYGSDIEHYPAYTGLANWFEDQICTTFKYKECAEYFAEQFDCDAGHILVLLRAEDD